MTTGSRIVALTGADGFLGRRLLLRLEDDPSVARVIVLDVRAPDLDLRKVEFHRVDLTRPTSGQEMAAVIGRADTFVHLAFLQRPARNTAWAHELTCAGTMHVLNACAEAGTPRLVVGSTTLIYGPSPKNPNFISEDHPLPAHGACPFLDDAIEVERQIRRTRDKQPRRKILVLRFAPIVGPTVRSLATLVMERRLVEVPMGYDPLVQLLHEEDAVDALALAVQGTAEGEYNIVPRGVVPLSRALAAAGALALPVPARIGRRLRSALWSAQLSRLPPGVVDFMKDLCVADGTRARRGLGFEARRTSAEAALSFAQSLRLRHARVA